MNVFAAGPQMTNNPNPRTSAPMGYQQAAQQQAAQAATMRPAPVQPAADPQALISQLRAPAPQGGGMGMPQPAGKPMPMDPAQSFGNFQQQSLGAPAPAPAPAPRPFEGATPAPGMPAKGGKSSSGPGYARTQPVAPARDFR